MTQANKSLSQTRKTSNNLKYSDYYSIKKIDLKDVIHTEKNLLDCC